MLLPAEPSADPLSFSLVGLRQELAIELWLASEQSSCLASLHHILHAHVATSQHWVSVHVLAAVLALLECKFYEGKNLIYLKAVVHSKCSVNSCWLRCGMLGKGSCCREDGSLNSTWKDKWQRKEGK